MKNSVLHFLLLKLKVLFKFALDYVNECFEATEILLKKSFEIYLEQKFYLNLIFVLVLTKTNILIKKKNGK